MKASWLFTKHPIVVDSDLAKVVGLNEAIVLQQLNYWLHSKSAKKIDGKVWVYNTYKNWHEQNFPFWSERTIRRIFTSLKNKGVIITGNFNKAGFDKTRWYSIDEDKINQLMDSACVQNGQSECPKWTGTCVQNGHTNTRDYTETTTDIDDDDRQSKNKEELMLNEYEMFNEKLSSLERATLLSKIKKLPIEVAQEVFNNCVLRDSKDAYGYLTKSLDNAIKVHNLKGGDSND